MDWSRSTLILLSGRHHNQVPGWHRKAEDPTNRRLQMRVWVQGKLTQSRLHEYSDPQELEKQYLRMVSKGLWTMDQTPGRNAKGLSSEFSEWAHFFHASSGRSNTLGLIYRVNSNDSRCHDFGIRYQCARPLNADFWEQRIYPMHWQRVV